MQSGVLNLGFTFSHTASGAQRGHCMRSPVRLHLNVTRARSQFAGL